MEIMNNAYSSGVAVVVGGSGGIGQGICLSLARMGSDVAVTYRNSQDAANRTVQEARQLGRSAAAVQLDTTSRDQMDKVFQDLEREFGQIHSVIYAVGADISMTYLANVDPKEWDDTIASELGGFFNVIKVALPALRRAGGGSIVAITSAGINRHPPLDVLSVAPKAAIESLIRAIAREEGRFNIRANAVAPGVIDAGLFDRLRTRVTPEFVDAMKKNTALRRFGTVDEIADVVAFLCSRSCAYMTGQSISIDGGFSV